MTTGGGNCSHTAAPYPSYGPGLGGWRERLIRNGNQLARRMRAGEGSGEWESFGAWLETAVKAAPASELKDLVGDL